MNKKSKAFNILIYIWLSVLALFILFPLVYTVASSFKTNSEILAHPEHIFPTKPTFDNYKMVWDSKNFSVKTMLCNSIIYTVSCVIITLFTSSLCGYVFERGHFPGKKALFAVFCSLMFIGMGSITMYPYFEILDFLHLERSLYSLILLKIFGIPITNIYLVKGFIKSIPKDLDEAAKIDGASEYRIFFQLIIPLSKPVIATGN